MKLFRILPLVVGSAAAGILASTSPAHALDFNFTFTGNNGTINATVNGTIYGLSNNNTGAATDIVVTSTTSSSLNNWVGVNLVGQPGISINSNSFTVANGTITNSDFLSTDTSTGQSILGLNDFLNQNILQSFPGEFGASSYNNTFNNTSFSGATYHAVPFDIPGGATIPTIGSILALGALNMTRKSIASKTRLANPVAATVS